MGDGDLWAPERRRWGKSPGRNDMVEMGLEGVGVGGGKEIQVPGRESRRDKRDGIDGWMDKMDKSPRVYCTSTVHGDDVGDLRGPAGSNRFVIHRVWPVRKEAIYIALS